jgi:AcrR family transcriptional regulator
VQGKAIDRKEARADRAAKIKEAAIEVFAEQGYHQTKVSTIVGRVGVAQGTFYLYYKGKSEMFSEILGDFLQLIREAVAAWDVGRLETVEDLRAGLLSLGEILIKMLVANRKLAQIFFNEALAHNPEFTAQINSFYDDLGDLMTGINRLNHQRGLLRAQDFRVLTLCTMGMVERNIQRYIVQPDADPTLEEVQHVVQHIVDLFLYGAAAPPQK